MGQKRHWHPARDDNAIASAPRLSDEDRRELEAALAELIGLRDELQAELRRQEAA